MNNRYLLLLLLIILCVPSIWYLFMHGFPVTDDGNWMIIRFSAFYQSFVDGQIPVRFLGRLNYGFGYPVANFLYPGFMYLGLPIKILGFSFITTIKIIVGASVVASGAFVFLWLEKLYDRYSAFFAALFYVYVPYHLFDVAKRGSVGEILSLSVLPFIFWQIERKSLVYISLGIALLMISHNILAALFLPLVVAYMAFSYIASKEKQELLALFIKSMILGLGASAFFFLPALSELPYTVFSQTSVSDYANYFADYMLLIPPLAVLVVAPIIFALKNKLLEKHRLTILFIIIGLVSIFLSSSLSDILWKLFPVSFVQFPFRLLSISIVCAAFVIAFCLSQVKRWELRVGAGVIALVATVFFSLNYLLVKDFTDNPDAYYFTNEATTTVKDEYMPIWVQEKAFRHPDNKVEIVKGEGQISDVAYDQNMVSFVYNSKSPSVVQVNTIYYPGFVAQADGRKKAIFYDNKGGLIQLKLTDKDERIKVYFSETPLRIMSDVLSLVSIAIILSYGVAGLNIKKISSSIHLPF